MSISSEQSELITRLIQAYITDSAPDPINLRQLVAEKSVLPLLVDMGGVVAIDARGEIISFPFGLNANGQIIAFPLDDSEQPRVESDPRIRNIALFQGSKKYAELKDLIPQEPDDARVCPHCGGTGIDPYAIKLKIDNIVCYCGGLGWIP